MGDMFCDDKLCFENVCGDKFVTICFVCEGHEE